MSLVPYHPREGRQIVLRHHNALVVRDPTSHRLEIRGLANCPTCNRPWQRGASPERHYDRSSQMHRDQYVDPNYFRMLRPPEEDFSSDHAPASPVRRLAEPVRDGDGSNNLQTSYIEIEDEDSRSWRGSQTRRFSHGSKIKRESFSQNYFNDFFVEEGVLGRGGKGVVLLVRHELDGCDLGLFACKRVPVGDDHAWLEKTLVEVRLLAQLGHPNLVSYRHVWIEDTQLTRFGPSVVCVYILQQYCNNGDLHQYVVGDAPKETTKEALKEQMRRRSKGQAEMPTDPFSGKLQLPPEEIYSLFKDITSGVAHLHAANYVHRDLKPSNCLLHRDRETGTLMCLISDFGEVQPDDVVRKSTGSTGTISYCAPEVLRLDVSGQYGNFTQKSDIFSMGMILYFMCFGRLPYRSANALHEELEDIDELRAEITDWQGFQEEKRMRPDLPPKLYQLLKQLLALSPVQRPSAADVLYALNNEANFDALSKGGRAAGSTIGLRGRVQNLDSPAPPGTPVPDPRKTRGRPRAASPALDDSWQPPEANSLLHLFEDGHEMNGLKRRSTAMTLSRSREGNSSKYPSLATEGGSTEPEEPLSSPLLLPAPSTGPVGRFKRTLDFWVRPFGPNKATMIYAGRMSLFLLKLGMLVRPCWPYVPNLGFALPLILLAALDIRSSLDENNPSQLATAQRGQGWKTSLSLLILHLGVLWLASNRGTFCAMLPQDSWHEW